MDATKNPSVFFDSVTDDPAIAMRTRGCHHLYRALETVEHVAFTIGHYFKALVILISAKFTLPHKQLLFFEILPKLYASAMMLGGVENPRRS